MANLGISTPPFCHVRVLVPQSISHAEFPLTSPYIQISSEWPGTSSRVSVGMCVRRGSSTLRGNSANPVLQTAPSVWQQIAASTAAQDTSSETASASRWSAKQVREHCLPIKKE